MADQKFLKNQMIITDQLKQLNEAQDIKTNEKIKEMSKKL